MLGQLLFLFLFSGAPEIPDAVKEYVRQRVEYGYEPSIAIGMVSPEGTTVFAFGLQEEGKPRVDEKTVYEIGSISKVFTATLLVDAVKQGLVELDAPIDRYLPDGVKAPSRDGKSITLRHLATHTSALPRLPDNLKPQDETNPYADYSFEQLYDFLGRVELGREIGAQYEYSNLGMGLLGHILELVSGKSYETLVRERIAEPLGMTDTVIRFREDQSARIAPGHNMDGEKVSNWDIPTLAGAGALRATVADMLLFLKANLGLVDLPLKEVVAETHAERHHVSDDMQIGLAWHIRKRDGQRIVWHNGGTGGYRSYCGFDPEAKLGAVVLTNSTFGADDLGIHLLDPNHPLPPVRRAIALDTEAADQLVGTYIGSGPALTVSRNGNALYVQRFGRSTNRVFPMAEDKFFYKIADILLSFERDDNGKVTGAVFEVSGAKTQYARQP